MSKVFISFIFIIIEVCLFWYFIFDYCKWKKQCLEQTDTYRKTGLKGLIQSIFGYFRDTWKTWLYFLIAILTLVAIFRATPLLVDKLLDNVFDVIKDRTVEINKISYYEEYELINLENRQFDSARNDEIYFWYKDKNNDLIKQCYDIQRLKITVTEIETPVVKFGFNEINNIISIQLKIPSELIPKRYQLE